MDDKFYEIGSIFRVEIEWEDNIFFWSLLLVRVKDTKLVLIDLNTGNRFGKDLLNINKTSHKDILMYIAKYVHPKATIKSIGFIKHISDIDIFKN